MLESELSRLLISVVMLLGSSIALGNLFQKILLPRVVGEVFSGILLGPSVLEYLRPQQYEWIFRGFDSQEKMLSVFYYLGLIFLMLSAGLSVPRLDRQKDIKIITSLFFGGILIPFTAGYFLATTLPNSTNANPLAFKLTLATAAAVTSIPVLSRIFFDLNILSNKFAIRVLTAAAFQDVILWVVLSIAISIEEAGSQNSVPQSIFIKVIISTALFIILVSFIFPRVLRFFNSVFKSEFTESSLVGYSILTALSIITLATLLKVNLILGALLAGIVLNQAGGQRMNHVKQNIMTFSNSFLVPIYFALVGLQINLVSFSNWDLLALVLLVSSMIKVLSVALFSRIASKNWFTSLDFGITMNARGGPGIVLASLARQAGIISSDLFVVLILVSLITSTISGFWLRLRREFI